MGLPRSTGPLRSIVTSSEYPPIRSLRLPNEGKRHPSPIVLGSCRAPLFVVGRAAFAFLVFFRITRELIEGDVGAWTARSSLLWRKYGPHGLRDECLNTNWFRNLMDARAKITARRNEYNGERPHSSLGYRTPNKFAAILKSSVMAG